MLLSELWWLLVTEVKVTVAHGQLKRGDRLQVDIHDPAVAGLIKAGYLKIHWKEAGDGTDSLDPVRSGPVSAGSVDPGDTRAAAEEVADGAGEHQPEQKDSDRASAGRSARTPGK